MPTHQLHSKVIFGILAFCIASYPFSGRVIDERNNPVDGVRVTTSRSTQQAVTLKDGVFSFSTSITHFASYRQKNDRIHFNGHSLRIAITTAPQSVRISQFDPAGHLISRLYEHGLDVGIHEISLKTTPQNSTLSIMHITIGNDTYILKTMQLRTSTFSNTILGQISTTTALQKSILTPPTPSSDTLLLMKDGYLNKRVIIKEQNEILGDLRMYDTAFTLTSSNFPKLDGSTTNVPLARIIACKFLHSFYSWRQTGNIPANSYWEVIPDSTDNVMYNQIMAMSSFSKTPQSYDSLIAGKRDLILVASAPSQRHYQAATASGIDFDIRPFAIDALLMVVNKRAAIAGITTQNIRDIYTKQATNWQQIGGPDLLIEAYQREETSGSQELMKILVMKGTPINPAIPLLLGMMSVFESLHFSTRAISYTPYYYKEFQMRDTLIRSMKVDGITPDGNSLYTRTYPHCSEVLVVSRTDLGDTTQAAKLRDWLLAPQGQRVVKESGYVPVREPEANPSSGT